MKAEICKAFCDDLGFRELEAGFVVTTAFSMSSGDPLGFFIVGPDGTGRYRIEDDGTTVPLIEAAGAELGSPTRADAFQSMLEEYGASIAFVKPSRGYATALEIRFP